jgi:7-cyano-7-deazaguanine synthase in queuosine biosynthesis
MPRPKHLVLCGGAEGRDEDRKPLKLDLHGPARNVRLEISDISQPLMANLPGVLVDLLEVASYVYAADSATSRGGETDRNMGEWWRRDFRFVIPVRDPDLWSSTTVASALIETLNFLSDDQYAFEFCPFADPPVIESYFSFPDTKGSVFSPDEIILFSGGIDSFAGAVEELANSDRKVALVSHRSAPKIASAQRHLVSDIRNRFGANHLPHIAVWAHMLDKHGQESTHRTRSFLFAALGAVTAQLFEKTRILFFENGVVSLNLPPVAQVVGARATRTTHPQTLGGFRRILSEIFGHPFRIENPFGWLTKAEVVERIVASGCGDLIRYTRSCTRIREMTTYHSHCGQCSQCLDRRFAVLAAGKADEDPEDAYKVKLFSGARPPGRDREMALAFVRSASDIQRMDDSAFFEHYGEASRVVDCFDDPADMIAGKIFDLYRRHADHVCRVFDEAIRAHASQLRDGSLPLECLLSLFIGQRGGVSEHLGQTAAPVKAIPMRTGIWIALDASDKRVVFNRWGEIKGANAQLLLILAAPFRKAVQEECVPERFPFISAGALSQQIGCAQETLRQRVNRCRNEIARMASEAGDPVPSDEDVIENIPWHGYRLNPNGVRIVAMSDLTLAERSRFSGKQVTSRRRASN